LFQGGASCLEVDFARTFSHRFFDSCTYRLVET
jgi:hypothetical protein